MDDVKGLPEFIRATKQIQNGLPQSLARSAAAVARDVVSGARGMAHTPQARLAASTLTAGASGEAGTISSNAALFAGAEFGGGGRPTTRQFPPHQGKRGYFLYPYMRANADRLERIWDEGVEDAMKVWDYSPGLGA